MSEQKSKIKTYSLKNGLKIILNSSKKAPVASVQVWVRTGSADEPKELAGVSHFIEHLLFKGTKKYANGEIANIVEASGGEMNAYTSFDQTVFYITLPSQNIYTALDVLSDMMGRPLFLADEIDREREVVIEEIKMGLDSPGRKSSQQFFTAAYEKHPYAVPVIGYEDIIRKVTPEAIRKYYEGRYTPPNMFLMISGDFDEKKINKQIESTFGEMPKTSLKKAPARKYSAPKNTKIQVESASFQKSMAYMGFTIPTVTHKDILALEVAALILGQGDSSRLVDRLRIREPLVMGVSAGLFEGLEAGQFIISFTYSENKLPEIQKAMAEEIQKLIKNGVTEEEFQKAKFAFESDQLYTRETVDGLARQGGYFQFYYNNPSFFESALKKLQKLSVSDVNTAIKKYIHPKQLTLTLLTNQDLESSEKELKLLAKQLQPVQKSHKAKSSKKTSAGGKKLQYPKAPIETHIHGVKVLFWPLPDTHTFSVRFGFLGGARLDSKEQLGLSELLSKSFLSGTRFRTEAQILKEVEEISASISASSGRSSFSVALDGLSMVQTKAGALFKDVLLNRVDTESILERERTVQLQQIKSREDNPAQVCGRAFTEAIFSGHPYAHDPLGSPETLAKLRATDLQNLWSQNFSKSGAVVVVGGNFEADYWKSWIEEVISQMNGEGREFHRLSLEPLSQPKEVFTKVTKEQNHLIVGYRGISFSDPDKAALQVMQAILAGMGGRLFMELREKNSLAYSVAPVRMEGVETGYFGIYIGCSPEKTELAKELMQVELRKLMNEPVPEEEIRRSQEYLVGRNSIDEQRTSSRVTGVLYNALYGIPLDEVLQFEKWVRAVKAEDIQRVAKRLFVTPTVSSLVGQKK